MAEKHQQSQEGQTLVTVALLMVVLLAFAALAIDFGRIYLQRRFDQNGADAGALAGARAMCYDNKTYDEAKVVAEAFARQNVPNSGQTQVSFPAAGAGIMEVTVQQSALPTWLARSISMDSIDVGATAAAACGPSDAVCGLFPIAFPQIQWDPLKASCNPATGEGDYFYTWSGDEEDRKKSIPDCSVCECDTNGDGVEDVISEEGRAWLDFTGVIDTDDPLYSTPCGGSTGCGTSEIVCWINNLEPAPIKIPPGGGLCVGGDRGVRAGTKDDIDRRAKLPYPNNIVHIPIFSGSCTPPNCLEGYNVVELGCVKVIGWEMNKELLYKDGTKGTCWKGKLIRTQVSCDKKACMTQCGHTTGGGCPSGTSTICTVNLIK